MISSLSWHSSNKFDSAHLDSLKMLRHDNDQINLSLFIWLNRIFDKFGNSWTFVLKIKYDQKKRWARYESGTWVLKVQIISLRRILSRLPTANFLRLSNAQASLALRSA